jgi:hypothetical protein
MFTECWFGLIPTAAKANNVLGGLRKLNLLGGGGGLGKVSEHSVGIRSVQ